MSHVDRGFVLHAERDGSPGMVWSTDVGRGAVSLTVVVPTMDAHRGGTFHRLVEQIFAQDYGCFELIVIRGDTRQGRAINTGAGLAKGRYLLTLDDDTQLPDCATLGKLVDILEKHSDIGIAGGNNVVPHGAPFLVRRVMKEIPRRSWKPVSRITDSDLAEHPCMIMRTAEFKRLGGENELLPRGLDPYLRQVYRDAGLRVVVVPGVVYHHLPPSRMRGLMRQFFRNGSHAAYVNRHYPQWAIETPSDHGDFRARVPFGLRLLRFALRLARAFITGKPFLFLCETAYALGFVSYLVGSREQYAK